MHRSQKFAGLLAVLAILIFLDFQLPITTVLKLAEDEGFDLMTGFLSSKGFVLYKDIWWDQPPLVPICLGFVFHFFGPTLAGARLIAAAFGLLFFGSFYWLVIQRLNAWAAFLATFFLISSPVVLLVSLSVIQEVPAYAVGLLSVCLLFRWTERQKPFWLWLSACVMGTALGVKLTAAMVFPAVLAEIAFTQWNGKTIEYKKTFVAGCQWVGAALLVFFAISLLLGKGGLQIAYRSHLGARPLAGMQTPQDFPFPLHTVLTHIECVAAASVGVWLALRGRLRRQLAFPVSLLATALAVHLVHRPYWDYYYVHLAVPLAWLAGYAVSEALAFFLAVLPKGSFLWSRMRSWIGLAAGVLAALVMVRSERRLEAEITGIRTREKADANAIVVTMKSYRPKTRWAYAQEPIYPFAAQLLVPPELADVTIKRFWSRQLAPSDVLEIAKRYGVEQAVLNTQNIGNDWQQWLQANFAATCTNNESTLYVLKMFNP